MKDKFLITPLLAIPAITIFGLFSGSSWLNFDIFKGVPLGNIAISASLITLSVINYYYLALHPFNRMVSLLIIVLAILWYPIGIVWSGNLKLIFTKNGDLWLPFSYVVAGICLFAIIVNFLIYFFRSK